MVKSGKRGPKKHKMKSIETLIFLLRKCQKVLWAYKYLNTKKALLIAYNTWIFIFLRMLVEWGYVASTLIPVCIEWDDVDVIKIFFENWNVIILVDDLNQN